MSLVLDHLLSQCDPRLLRFEENRFKDHLFELEQINSRLYEKSRSQLFKDDEFSYLMKKGFKSINSFVKSFVFEECMPILKPKVIYPLSYLTPKSDPHLKFGKTKLNGCINPHNGFPCGKCLYCLEHRRLPWTIRLTYERKFWSHFGIPTYFVTLTYDESNVPEDGVSKRDIQLFLKRLRKSYNKLELNKLKYFLVSEYGPTTLRPHYHLILFGLNRDLSFVLQLINQCWNKGFIKVSKVKPSRIKYVTKYSTKFFDTLTDEQKEILLKKNCEFRLMSKGLGISFLSQQQIDYYRNNPDKLTLVLEDIRYYLPRYYRDKIFDTNDLQFKHQCFEDFLKRHLDFISYYYKNFYWLDQARELNGSPSVYRQHYDQDVKRYVDYTLKKVEI